MNILEQIGLTKTEAKLYRLLLSLGETKLAFLQKETGLHPQIVYRTIDTLKGKGLVSVVRKKNTLHATAETPKELVRLEQQRLNELKEALPDLLALQKSPSLPMVHVSKGDVALRAFREKAYQKLSRNDVLYVIGGSGDRFYTAMGEQYGEIEQLRIKKKIHKRLIAPVSEKEKFAKDAHTKYGDFRYLPDDFPVVSSTNIYGDVIGIIIWAEEPILITITSHEVAESYKNYFRQLWQLAARNL